MTLSQFEFLQKRRGVVVDEEKQESEKIEISVTIEDFRIIMSCIGMNIFRAYGCELFSVEDEAENQNKHYAFAAYLEMVAESLLEGCAPEETERFQHFMKNCIDESGLHS